MQIFELTENLPKEDIDLIKLLIDKSYLVGEQGGELYIQKMDIGIITELRRGVRAKWKFIIINLK